MRWCSKGKGRNGEDGMNLTDVYSRKLSELEDKLACGFKLMADMVRVKSGNIAQMDQYS